MVSLVVNTNLHYVVQEPFVFLLQTWTVQTSLMLVRKLSNWSVPFNCDLERRSAGSQLSG